MSESWDALKADLRDAGVTDDFIGRIEAANAASPLRKELGEWKSQAETLKGEVQKFRNNAISGVLQQHGFTGRADALNIPADLDPNDPNKVTEWAAEMGLIQPPAPSSEEQQRQAELAAHQRIAEVGAGAAPPPAAAQTRDDILSAGNAKEFWEKAQQAGLVVPGVSTPQF